MVQCGVLGCKNRPERKTPNITFHLFPKDTNIRKVWVAATGRKTNWQPDDNDRMCSKHFESRYIRKKQKKTYLVKDAIPTLFIFTIHGQSIAVDLSGWICDSQNVTDYFIQPKLYLRNLFFRTIYLLLAGINPIFVLEGDAPELKRDVMAARNALQFRGAVPREDKPSSKKPDVARKRFKGVLKECESLLTCMGVVCVKGTGEAEATCAQLNAQVVSQDSDCFAYGAKRVYRNFSVSSSAGGGALAGSVDCYDADKMFESNGFGRNKMVALALLCGCDYGPGACGTSINTVVAFLNTVLDSEIIPRLLSWVSDPDHYAERSRWVSVPGRCERCGHAGRNHGRTGCPTCVTDKQCHDTGHKAKIAEVKRELSLRTRALSCGSPFPEPKVIKEFLNSTQVDIDVNKILRPAPNLIQFVKLMSRKLEWSERYCVVKFLPLLTKIHLQDHVPSRTIKPVKINKKRTPRGVPSFEVVWSDINGEYDGLITDDQFEQDEDPSVPWTTIERQDLMRKYYPKIVEAFEEATRKPVKEKKNKTKKKEIKEVNTDKPKRKYNRKVKKVDKIVDMENNVSDKKEKVNGSKHNVSVLVNKLKRKRKNKEKQRTIDSFIANKRRKSSMKAINSLRHSFKNMSIVNDDAIENCDYLIKNKENKENEDVNDDAIEDCNFLTKNKESKENDDFFNMFEATADDVHDNDLSDVIDSIVSKAPAVETTKVDNRLIKLVFDKYSTPKKTVSRKSVLSELRSNKNCSTPNTSPIRRNSLKYRTSLFEKSTNYYANINTSSFFDRLNDNGDAFELSMDFKHKSSVICLDCDSTVNYSLPNEVSNLPEVSLPDVYM